MLAHHLTAAGRAEAAIPLWQRAGELALRRVALTEAIAHLNQGLELVAPLPWSSQRDARELGLRTHLGTAWLALKGWPALEVWTSLHPALALAKSLQRHDTLTPVLFGLFCNVQSQGRIAEALPWVQEMLHVAPATGDADLRITGHMTACSCCTWLGEFSKAVEHADKMLDLYDDEKHRHLIDILVHDPKTLTYTFASVCTWILGFPDRALQLGNEAITHARRRGHPFDLGWALNLGAHWFDHRVGHKDLDKRAEECEWLGRENSLPVLRAILAAQLYGLARLREGKPAEAIAPIRANIAAFEAAGGRNCTPTWRAFLAEATALAGDLDGALLLLDEATAQIERPGWQERWCYAEILRLNGWVLWLKGDLEAAERNFLTSLDWARRQQAKMWELRTSTSLARLWQSQERRQEAYELLAPVYDWFTEGLDTKDLQEAKALLDELAS